MLPKSKDLDSSIIQFYNFLNRKEVLMSVMAEVSTPQKILEIINTLTRSDQQWIMRQLSQSLGQAVVAPLPAQTSLEETLTLGDAERDRFLALLEFPPAPSETTKAAMRHYLKGCYR